MCSSTGPWERLRRTTSTPARRCASSTRAVTRRPERRDDLRPTGHAGCSRIFGQQVTPAYQSIDGVAADPSRAARAARAGGRARPIRSFRRPVTRRPCTSPSTSPAKRSTPSTPARSGARSDGAPLAAVTGSTDRGRRRRRVGSHSPEYVPVEELKAANDPRWQALLEGVGRRREPRPFRAPCARRDRAARRRALGRPHRGRLPRRRDQRLPRARPRPRPDPPRLLLPQLHVDPPRHGRQHRASVRSSRSTRHRTSAAPDCRSVCTRG